MRMTKILRKEKFYLPEVAPKDQAVISRLLSERGFMKLLVHDGGFPFCYQLKHSNNVPVGECYYTSKSIKKNP